MIKIKPLMLFASAMLYSLLSMGQDVGTVNHFSAAQCVAYAAEHNVQVRNALLNVKIQEQVNRSVTALA